MPCGGRCSGPAGRRLLRSVALHWYYLGRVAELPRWIDAALEGDTDPEVSGPLIVLDAIAAWASGDTAGALARLDQADVLSDHLPPGWRSEAIGQRATILTFGGDLDAAAGLLEKALAIATAEGSRISQAMSHLRLGRIALTRGDLDAAQLHLDRSLALFQEVGSPWGIANATGNLAELWGGGSLFADGSAGGNVAFSADNGQTVYQLHPTSWSERDPGYIDLCLTVREMKGSSGFPSSFCIGDPPWACCCP